MTWKWQPHQCFYPHFYPHPALWVPMMSKEISLRLFLYEERWGITRKRKLFRIEPREEWMLLLVFFCFQLFFQLASVVFLATSLLVSSGCSKSILLIPYPYQSAHIAEHSMPMMRKRTRKRKSSRQHNSSLRYQHICSNYRSINNDLKLIKAINNQI